MARAGRKRKNGQRHKNGNIKQPTSAQRQIAARTKAERLAATLKLEDREKAVVLVQPHRGEDQDQLSESSLGRLVLRHKLRREIFYAAVEWGKFMRRWLAIKGVPTEIHTAGGSGLWPAVKTVRGWDLEVLRVEGALKKISPKGFEDMRTLAVAEREINYLEEDGITCAWPPPVVLVLQELAVQTHNIPRNQHPFAGQEAKTA